MNIFKTTSGSSSRTNISSNVTFSQSQSHATVSLRINFHGQAVVNVYVCGRFLIHIHSLAHVHVRVFMSMIMFMSENDNSTDNFQRLYNQWITFSAYIFKLCNLPNSTLVYSVRSPALLVWAEMPG